MIIPSRLQSRWRGGFVRYHSGLCAFAGMVSGREWVFPYPGIVQEKAEKSSKTWFVGSRL